MADALPQHACASRPQPRSLLPIGQRACHGAPTTLDTHQQRSATKQPHAQAATSAALHAGCLTMRIHGFDERWLTRCRSTRVPRVDSLTPCCQSAREPAMVLPRRPIPISNAQQASRLTLKPLRQQPCTHGACRSGGECADGYDDRWLKPAASCLSLANIVSQPGAKRGQSLPWCSRDARH